jgi:hypothetical protein
MLKIQRSANGQVVFSSAAELKLKISSYCEKCSLWKQRGSS